MEYYDQPPFIKPTKVETVFRLDAGKMQEHYDLADRAFVENGGVWNIKTRLRSTIYKAAVDYYAESIERRSLEFNSVQNEIFQTTLGLGTVALLREALDNGVEIVCLDAYISLLTKGSKDYRASAAMRTQIFTEINNIPWENPNLTS